MAEKVSVFTPLGIRFWDSVLDRPVDDHLIVKAYPGSGSGPVVDAFRTASGVYAFQGLPGLREVEAYDGDGVPPEPPGGRKRFIIAVNDKLRRFLPVNFHVDLPLPYRGIYRFNGDNHPDSRRFYLLSAPTRPVSTGLAVIHTALIERVSGKPAAHAVMKVQVEEEDIHYGVADERGCIAILFPYPTMNIPLTDSPPADADNPVLLRSQSWPVTIRVHFEPDRLEIPLNMKIPGLPSILKQSEGVILTEYSESPVTETFVDEWSAVLTFDRELVLRTECMGKSELWIDKK